VAGIEPGPRGEDAAWSAFASKMEISSESKIIVVKYSL
jgi:hypothetical protein